jgi:hypothetical protein
VTVAPASRLAGALGQPPPRRLAKRAGEQRAVISAFAKGRKRKVPPGHCVVASPQDAESRLAGTLRVEPTGFEPVTSCLQSSLASRLQGPNSWRLQGTVRIG